MKSILVLSFLFITLQLCAQNSATISGQIIDIDGRPVEHITVRLLNTAFFTTTNANGEFTLTKVTAGNYTLEVTGTGFRAEKQNIVISGASTDELILRLNSAENTLTEVVVTAKKMQRYTETITGFGTKTTTPILAIPQSVKVIGRSLIDDRQAIDIQEVYRNVSGVSYNTAEANPTIRGFISSKPYINGTRGNFMGNEVQLTLVNAERVEFLKGPSSILYGFAQPGGVINVVTKKPLPVARYNASVTAGTWGRARTDLDATGPVTKDGRLLYRLNIGYQNAPDYRPFHFNRNLTIAPTLSYAVSEKTTVSVEFVHNRIYKTLWFDWGVPPIKGDLAALPLTYSVHEPTDFVRWNQNSLEADVDHRFSETVSFHSTVFIASSTNQGEVHSPNFLAANGGAPDTAGNVARLFRVIDFNRNSTFATNYFTIRFATGSVKHTLLAGVDYFKGFSGSLIQGAAGRADSVPSINVFAPRYGQRSIKDYRLFTTANRSAGYENSTTQFVGGYLQDQIDVKPWLKFILAIRHDVYKFNRYPAYADIENKPVLPSGAVVMGPFKHTTAYFTASKGFVPQNNQDLTRGGPFDPEISKQAEAGIKHERIGGRLVATGALYRMKRTNFLVPDPTNAQRLLQTGETTAEGFEFDIIGAITANLRVNANYSYNEINITKTTQTNLGSRPTSQPLNLAGAWLRYTLSSGVLNGLGVGLGANYASEGKNATLTIPSYTYADAALYYTRSRVSVSFNLNNVTNKRYYQSTGSAVQVYPGLPRNFLLRLSMTY